MKLKKEGITHPIVEISLITEVKKACPETKRMTVTGMVDYALRKLIKQAKEKQT